MNSSEKPIIKHLNRALHTLAARPHIFAVRRLAEKNGTWEITPDNADVAAENGDVATVATFLKSSIYPREQQRQMMRRTIFNRAEHIHADLMDSSRQQNLLLSQQRHHLRPHAPEEAEMSEQEQEKLRLTSQHVGKLDDSMNDMIEENNTLSKIQERLRSPRVYDKALDMLTSLPLKTMETIHDIPRLLRRRISHPLVLAYTSTPSLSKLDAKFGGSTVWKENRLHKELLEYSLGEGLLSITNVADLVRHEGLPASPLMQEALQQRIDTYLTDIAEVGRVVPLSLQTITAAREQLVNDINNLTAFQQGKRRAKHYHMQDGTPVPSLPKRLLRKT